MLSKFISTERLIHSLKTAIAVIIGFGFAKVINLQADQWIVITIIVVMCAQLYVGSVLQKAYLRFLGTLLGCLLAAFTIVVFGNTHLAVAITIGLSSFLFSYYATGQENFGYAGTLGAVTTAIIMLGQVPTVIFAAERFLEISAGLLIATLVSQFILPIHARTHLKRSQTETLKQLRSYYETTLSSQSPAPRDNRDLDEAIVKSLLKQRQLAKESVNEKLGSTFDTAHFMQTLYFEREILRAITFMHLALREINRADIIIHQANAFHHFNDAVLRIIDALILTIQSGNPPPQAIPAPTLTNLKHDFQNNSDISSRHDLIYIDGFLFSAEVLAKGLIRLAKLYSVPMLQEQTAVEMSTPTGL